MRYIKPPKYLSDAVWMIGQSLSTVRLDRAKKHTSYIILEDYILSNGNAEYIVDARVFSSEILETLLTK